MFENPVTRERAKIIELPWQNTEGRAVAELTALPGARVAGEHMHPALHESFSVLEGELTVVRDGQRSTLRPGECARIDPGVWHDWFNETNVDAVVRIRGHAGRAFCSHDRDPVRAGARGARRSKGMPNLLQLALTAQEFSDVIVLRKPPPSVQRVVFEALEPIARRRGYRATYCEPLAHDTRAQSGAHTVRLIIGFARPSIVEPGVLPDIARAG